MSHEIHVSERRSFRGCRRRWNYAYVEGFVPDQPIKALEFGVAYHQALESFYNPETWSILSTEEKTERAIANFQGKCDEQRLNYLTAMKIRELPLEVAQDYDERFELGTGMLQYHGEFVHPKFDSWFKPVAVEIPFEVPIEDPDRPNSLLKCTNSPQCGQQHSNDRGSDDSNVVYAGRVDMLVEDVRFGGYFVWDHKTAAQLAKDDGFLQLDDQVGSYVWALRYILGLDIRGFIYAESRKDFPGEPKALKRLMGGRSFSTSKTQATSLEIFEPFVAKHDKPAYDEGCYDEYLAWLKSAEATQYHQRFTIIKSPQELRNIGRNIALEAADMVDSKTRIYPAVGRFTCSTCAYRQPCLSEFMDEDARYLLETTYTKTTKRYWMETPMSSEKAGK